MEKFELAEFTNSKNSRLSAFASDLEWKPGHFPPYMVVITPQGDLRFNRVSINSNMAIYRNEGRDITVFND